jgi:uncharacterized protein YrrD
MSTVHSRDLEGKSIISATDGQIIAKVDDVMVDPAALRVAALVTSKGGLLRREVKLIPSDRVQVWGQDVILVDQPDVIVKRDELPHTEEWLAVSGQLRGRDVVSTEGTRIGQLEDIVLDSNGELVSYDLGQVFVKDPQLQSKWIPARATRSLGQDVLIVDTTQME